jgi:prepilin-type N-terminal cleavage/methylation domain-containing protein
MKARGFTLIEVLLAMVLLSIVMYIGSLSFSVFSERWSKELGGFNQDVSETRKLLLLRQLFLGAANYLVRDASDDPVYLFDGNSQHVKFVTNAPIFQTDNQALVSLEVKTLADGQQQLVYNEYSFRNGPLLELNSRAASQQSLVLLQASNIRFNYFGWESFAARSRYIEYTEGTLQWHAQYNAVDIGMLPYAVNLTWQQNEPVIFPLNQDNRFKIIYVNEEN